MPSQYPYRTTIRNEYLGVSKVIRAMSRDELRWLAEAQRAKWADQEARRRQSRQKEAAKREARAHAENLKSQAEDDTVAAQQQLDLFRTLLSAGLSSDLKIEWEPLLDRRPFHPFQSNDPKPDRDAIRLQLLGPKPTEEHVPAPRPEPARWWELVLPFLRAGRLKRNKDAEERYQDQTRRAREDCARRLKRYEEGEREVVATYNDAANNYNAQRREEKAKYQTARSEWLSVQEAHNGAVLDFRFRYEVGSGEAVERYVQMVLERSVYPEPIAGEPEVRFDEPSQTLVVGFQLPGPESVPNVTEYRFVASRKAVKPVEMKQKEFEAFYDDVIHQIGLRTVREVFDGDYAGSVRAVVFNGWVSGTDRKTGRPFTSCVLTFEAPRERFTELDLIHVTPKECVRGFKGITAGPLVMLAPVKPIMELNRDDDRFVESKAVMDHLGAEDNLAAMEWEDFEHLVRELFEREFAASGGEVRVTQASRDRGVDAIAFDPDPIRGGKFVIQAKRYNMTIPVSAVRDLYGTMIAEGAVKGILVTTSHFGRDSREFAKDKPITLIDGENLVHMFQKHGRNVHIAILPKGDPRRGV